jgi:hypothetical protein
MNPRFAGGLVVVGLALHVGRSPEEPPTGPVGERHVAAQAPRAASAADWFVHVERQVARDAADVEEADGALWLRHVGSGLGLSLAADGRATLSYDGGSAALRTVGVRQGAAAVTLADGALAPGDCKRGEAREGCVRSAEVDQGGLTTWWRHAPEGLEQGWTVDAPLGDGALVVEVEASGGAPAVDDGRLSIGDGLVASEIVAVDDAGRALPVEAVATPDGFEITVDVDGAVFPVVIDPVWTPWSWTKAGPTATSGYGQAVALDGDVNGDGYADALVGAPGYGTSRASVGRVYLYFGGPAGLSTTADMTWTGTTARQRLGSGVAFLGDVNGDGLEDVALGSPGFSGGRSKQGAVHVYLGTTAGPSATAAFQLLGDRADRQLGGTLSRVGDVNGDGLDDVLAGVYGERAGPNEGAATWFPGGASMTTASGVVIARRSEYFGVLLAGVGDLDGDGYADFVVGDPGDRAFNDAYLYRGGPAGPVTPAARTWLNDGVGGATAGDFNGDGWLDLALSTWTGVTWYDGSASGLSSSASGSVPSTNWQWVRPLAAGDMNGDGFDDVLLGNPREANDAGTLRLMLGSAAGLVDDGEALLRGTAAGMQLGAALSIGDADGDGLMDALVGAPSADPEDSGLPAVPMVQTWRRGNAFLFSGGSNPLGIVAPMATFPGNNPEARFAFGDVNADGRPDLMFDTGSRTEARFGTPAGYPQAPSQTTVSVSTYSQQGIATCDVDGDGQAEVFQMEAGTAQDVVWTYETSPAGLIDPPTAMTVVGSPSVRSMELQCGGDLDGDGDEELLVLISNSQFWWVEVYAGSPTGLSTAARVRLGQPTCWSCDSHFVTAVAAGSDITGDGIDDLVGTVKGNRLVVWAGRAGGPNITPDQILTIPPGLSTLGYRVAAGGDLNGDGFDDVLIADQSAQTNGRVGAVFALGGSAAGVTTPPLARLVSLEGDTTLVDGAMAIVPDVTGDGYDDVVLGAALRPGAASAGEPLTWVYGGGPTGLSAAPAYATPWEMPIRVALPAGDLDGDGFGEVALISTEPMGTVADMGLWLLKYDGFAPSVVP